MVVVVVWGTVVVVVVVVVVVCGAQYPVVVYVGPVGDTPVARVRYGPPVEPTVKLAQ